MTERTGAPRTGRPPADRAFRPRRAFPAAVTAAVLGTVAALIAAEVIAALTGGSAGLLPVTWAARFGRGTSWDAPIPLAVASAIMALGLLLLLLALLPGRPRAIGLRCDDPDAVMGITPRGLRRHVARAAESVDGVSRARVRAGRRHVRVRASSPLHDIGGLDEQVRRTVTERIEELAPLRPPRLRVTVRHRRD